MIFSFAFSPLAWGIIALFFLALCLQLFYWEFFYQLPARAAKKGAKEDTDLSSEGEKPPVSIVLYTRNESADLERNIPLLMEQDYPEFEVIVVNDGSTDDTRDLISRLQYQYHNLYQTFVPEGAKSLSRRKLALTMGIKAARHDTILLTLANCKPLSKEWIRTMMQPLHDDTEVVIGAAFVTGESGFAGGYRRWDRLIHTFRFLSLALLKHPYRGCAYNLGYKKELFFKQRGFSRHLDLHYGDDDIFVNEIATSQNCAVAVTPNALIELTFDDPKAAWFEDKLRYGFTEKYLKGGATALFSVETASRYLFVLSLCALIAMGCFNGTFLLIGAIGSLLLTGAYMHVMRITKLYLYPVKKSPFVPIYVLIEPFISTYIWIIGRASRSKNYIWRKTR